MIPLTFNFYNVAYVHHLTICVTSFPCSQNVCTYGSEFLSRCAHSPIKFIFIDPNFCVGGGVCLFQALFCAYAKVLNEDPGVCFLRCCVGTKLSIFTV